MAGKKRTAEQLKAYQWKKGQSGNPKGRPPIIAAKVSAKLEAQGFEKVSKADVDATFRLILNMPKSEVDKVAKGEGDYAEWPMIFRIAAAELGNSRSRLYAMNTFLDRTLGKSFVEEEVKQDETLNQITLPGGTVVSI